MATKREKEYALALEQGSPEWHEFKVGKVGASKIADITAKLRGGTYGASRATYLGELIAERLTGVAADGFKSPAMQWGSDTEPMARAAYQFRTLSPVARVGCVLHPKIEDALCSPDGLIGSDGLVELKCPNTSTHCDFMLGAAIPDRYIQQVQWQLACTGRIWCDYASFDPRLPEDLRLWVHRIERDDNRIEELEDEVKGFLRDLELRLKDLGNLRGRGQEVAA
jgi:putative phage-type endonuclease